MVLKFTYISSPLGGASMATVRAVTVLAARAAGAERLNLLDVLLAAIRHRAGVRVAPSTSTSHYAEVVTAARALVAMRPRAGTGKNYCFT